MTTHPFANANAQNNPFDPQGQAAPEQRKVALICSRGGLDEAYPALILANAARMAGIEAFIFFTFYGLDVITEAKVDKLHVNMVGNPTSPMPTMVAGLPGMERVAAKMMKSQMKELDLPDAREMLEMLHGAGAKLYACQLAMDMMDVSEDELIEEVSGVINAADFYDLSVDAQIIFT